MRKDTKQQSLRGAEIGTAVISPDEVYRYYLDRELGGRRPLAICGLNPSTADAFKNDQTILKEIKFARSWCCGRLVKVNLDAFRTRDPKILEKARRAGFDVVGPENDFYIRKAVELVLEHDGIFLGAWGANARLDRVRHVVHEVIAGRVPIYCIKTNLDNSPVHPLYQPDASTYQRWSLAS